jgi:outer membrane protein
MSVIHSTASYKFIAVACGMSLGSAAAPLAAHADEPPETLSEKIQEEISETPPEALPEAPPEKTTSKKNRARIEALLSLEDLPGVTRKISLKEALEFSDSRNLSLAAVRMEIEKADKKVKQAWTAVMPTAQAEMQYTRADHADKANLGGFTGVEGSSIVINPANTLTGGISVNLPLVNAGAWKGIQLAGTSADLAELTVEDSRRAVLFATAQAYYTALMSRSLVALYKEQIRSTAHHLTVAERKFTAGSGLRIDVLRAGIDLEKAEKALSNAKLSLATACDALGILTGLDALVLPMPAPDLSAPVSDEQALVQEAANARTDLLLQRKSLKLARQQIDASWMALLPSLNMSWKGTYQFSDLSAMSDADRSRWNLFLNLTVPLFNHSDNLKIVEGKVAARQAELQIENLSQSVGQAVRQARREYQTALTDAQSARRSLDLAEETLNLSETAFEIGTGTSLEVTDSRRTHIEAEVNLVTSELKTQLALLNLLQAVGREPLD